jgi:hypothetical protein
MLRFRDKPVGQSSRPHPSRTPGAQILPGMATLLALAIALPCFAQVRPAEPLVVQNGKLETLSGNVLVLQMGNKDLKLSARASYLLHTLQDKRLAGKDVRLFGTTKPDGTFLVDHFFTVHDGKFFRVRYFCEVCNIEALEPGKCVCCQRPTELQEIPVPDPR